MKPIQPVKTPHRKVVVMRLPNLVATSTEVEEPAPESDALPATPANDVAVGGMSPTMLQSVIAGGAIVVIFAAYFIFSSETSPGVSDQPINAGVANPGQQLVDAGDPQLEPPPKPVPPLGIVKPDESELATDITPTPAEPTPATTIPAATTPAESPPLESTLTGFDSLPLSGPTGDNTTELNTPAGVTPENVLVAGGSSIADDYPVTQPDRWRYPEFEIRSPTEGPATPPRFADRTGAASPPANQRDATSWERR